MSCRCAFGWVSACAERVEMDSGGVKEEVGVEGDIVAP